MKVYLRENSVAIVGKKWQVKHVLKKYMAEFTTVQEWIDHNQKPNKPVLRRIK